MQKNILTGFIKFPWSQSRKCHLFIRKYQNQHYLAVKIKKKQCMRSIITGKLSCIKYWKKGTNQHIFLTENNLFSFHYLSADIWSKIFISTILTIFPEIFMLTKFSCHQKWSQSWLLVITILYMSYLASWRTT